MKALRFYPPCKSATGSQMLAEDTRLLGSLCSHEEDLETKDPITYKQTAACFYQWPLPPKAHRDGMEGLGWMLCVQRLGFTAEEPQA